MGVLGFILLLAGAVVVGFVGQAIGRRHAAYEWAIAGIGALAGAFVASEYVAPAGWRDFDGLAIVPALVGALVVGAVVELVYRTTTKAPEPAHH